ncbi:MAG: ABC transporter ATP-binding protein [Candidatus Ozemobacteraceae bacterium]
MKQISVRLDKLEKTFVTNRGSIQVLKKVDFEIQPGEFFVLLGPSGCGKSTLLNLIAGLEKPTSGCVQFGDRTVVDTKERIFLSPFDRDVAMVFQSYALYPHMTVEENMAFPLTNLPKRPENQEINRRVIETAKILQIEHLLKRKPAELSGGQRQRVAIGRAIIRNPAVFLMDEPLSNLDANLRMEMRAQIKDLHCRLGVTTIYVTHDQLEAMTLGNRIGVLNEGFIQQIGTPHEVFHLPVNEFVARFLGSPPMNIFRGVFFEKGQRKFFESEGIQIQLPPTVLSRLDEKRESSFSIGVRPEDFLVCSAEEASLTLTTSVVEPIGSDYLVHVFLPSGRVTIRTFEEPKSILYLKIIPDKIHLFDALGQRF